MEITRKDNSIISSLKHQATDRCYKGKQEDYTNIMSEMIERAYIDGIRSGARQQRELSRAHIANIMIPEID